MYDKYYIGEINTNSVHKGIICYQLNICFSFSDKKLADENINELLSSSEIANSIHHLSFKNDPMLSVLFTSELISIENIEIKGDYTYGDKLLQVKYDLIKVL